MGLFDHLVGFALKGVSHGRLNNLILLILICFIKDLQAYNLQNEDVIWFQISGLRLNLNYSEELTNKDSPEYVAFSKNFENTMLPEVQKGISNAIGIQVTDVRSGSIIVSFNVITKESTTGAPKVKASDVLTKVKKHSGKQ